MNRLMPRGMGRMTNLGLLLVVSAVLRALLVAYGEWQDLHMEVRYTDVDYLVFSDAAALMVEGSSPFRRSTYRYSPLLALILVPNSLIHPCWGKLLFSFSGEHLFIYLGFGLRFIYSDPEQGFSYCEFRWDSSFEPELVVSDYEF